MAEQKILMAIPTAGGIHEITAATAARIAQRGDVEMAIVKGRPVDYVRNEIVRQFLANRQFTHLFFCDSDIGLPLDAVGILLAADAPIAVGCYPLLMQQGLRWSLASKTDGHYRLLERLDNKPFNVDAGGAGCLLIRRDVLVKIDWPWFKWDNKEDGSQISEDIYFFDKCKKAGLPVVAVPQCVCNHYKEINLTALMRASKERKV